MEFMRWGIFGAATTAVALLIGLPYGALGVATAYAASEYVRTPLLWLYVGRRGPVRARDILQIALPVVLGAHVAVGVLWAVKQYLPESPIIALTLATCISYIVSAGTAAMFPAGRRALADVRLLAINGLR